MHEHRAPIQQILVRAIEVRAIRVDRAVDLIRQAGPVIVLEDLVIRALRDQSGLFCPFPCQDETVVVAGIR